MRICINTSYSKVGLKRDRGKDFDYELECQMSGNFVVLMELLLVFGSVLFFGVHQLRAVKRRQRELQIIEDAEKNRSIDQNE